MAEKLKPCPFCKHTACCVTSRKTSTHGDYDTYVAQVHCRHCLARGPAVKFVSEISAGYPDLDKTNPESAVSVAEAAAVERWNHYLTK